MKHTKMTALLCTLALSGCISATAASQAGSTPLDPYRAAVQKMKDLEKAEKKGEQSAPASAPAAAASAGDVNYTDALLKGLDLTVSDVQASVESGTFKNLSPEAPKPVVEQPAAEPEPAEEPEPETEPEPISPPVKKYTISQGETANELSSDGNYENGVYTSDKADENALRVPMAYITAPNAQITKTGDSTDVDSSRLYGQNAAFLATHGGRATMTRPYFLFRHWIDRRLRLQQEHLYQPEGFFRCYYGKSFRRHRCFRPCHDESGKLHRFYHR